MSYFDLSR